MLEAVIIALDMDFATIRDEVLEEEISSLLRIISVKFVRQRKKF